jgi:anti-anti-sigma factor
MGFEDNVAVLICRGDLTSDTREQLFMKAGEAMDLGIRNLAIGLKDVSFIDSTGFGSLVSLKNQVVEHDGDVRLFQLSPALEEFGRWVGLRKKFQSFNSRQSCIKSFQDQEIQPKFV